MKKIFLVSAFFLIISCSSSKITFEPEGSILPDAKLNTYYHQDVILKFADSGEVFFLNDNNSRVILIPEKSGLDIEPKFSDCDRSKENKCSGYDRVMISGVPKTHGVIHIEIVGRTYSSMYSKSQVFKKDYSITVD